MNGSWILQYLALLFCKELLRNAAKARITRMCAAKKKRTDLEVPGFLKEQWNKGTKEKEEMAQALQQVNWCKAIFLHSLQTNGKRNYAKVNGSFQPFFFTSTLQWYLGCCKNCSGIVRRLVEVHNLLLSY